MSMISPYPQSRDNPGLAQIASDDADALRKFRAQVKFLHEACVPTLDVLSDFDRRMTVVAVSNTLYGLLGDLQNAIDDALADYSKHGGD